MSPNVPLMCRYCPDEAEAAGLCARHRRADTYVSRDRRVRTPKSKQKRKGHGAEWARVSAAFLASNPLCAGCGHAGRLVPAGVVDHILPVRYFPELKFDASNFQSLCTRRPYSCHQRKTGLERRGIAVDFGRNRQISFAKRMRG